MSSLDPRVRRSRAALEKAFLELVVDRDLGEISVSDVTKCAGVNRSTFYEHYSDVHDLAVSACTAMFDEHVRSTPVLDTSKVETMSQAELAAMFPGPLPLFFEHLRDNSRIYRALLGPDGSARVINHLLERIVAATYLSLRQSDSLPGYYPTDVPDVPYDADSALVAGAVVGAIVGWLGHGCPTSPEVVSAALMQRLVAISLPMVVSD